MCSCAQPSTACALPLLLARVVVAVVVHQHVLDPAAITEPVFSYSIALAHMAAPPARGLVLTPRDCLTTRCRLCRAHAALKVHA
jgi:hypothetical protein